MAKEEETKEERRQQHAREDRRAKSRAGSRSSSRSKRRLDSDAEAKRRAREGKRSTSGSSTRRRPSARRGGTEEDDRRAKNRARRGGSEPAAKPGAFTGTNRDENRKARSKSDRYRNKYSSGRSRGSGASRSTDDREERMKRKLRREGSSRSVARKPQQEFQIEEGALAATAVEDIEDERFKKLEEANKKLQRKMEMDAENRLREEEARQREEQEREARQREEHERVLAKKKKTKRRNCIIVCVVVFILLAGGGGAAAAILLGGGSNDDAQVATKAPVETTDPKVVVTEPPNTETPTKAQTEYPTDTPLFVYEPPSERDCEEISNRGSVANQDNLLRKNFTADLDVELVTGSDEDTVASTLAKRIHDKLVPELTDCTRAFSRKLKHAERHLQLELYAIANADVSLECTKDDVCEKSQGLCYSCKVVLQLYLKGDVLNIYILSRLSELWLREDLVPFFEVGDFATLLLLASQFEAASPTQAPSPVPSLVPSGSPTISPSRKPTLAPIHAGSPTQAPSSSPSIVDSKVPTAYPTDAPTRKPTFVPTKVPTVGSTPVPTSSPTTPGPTLAPTPGPTLATPSPTRAPTSEPTSDPTSEPTSGPTSEPTNVPTPQPTSGPTNMPTSSPTSLPTVGATTDWIQIGQDIDGEYRGDYSGQLSLSSDGSIVAIAAGHNDDNGVDSGHVRVFQLSGSTWQQLGSDIDGEAAGEMTNFPALSGDGTILAVGAYTSDENGEWAGQVRVYEWSGSAWVQKGSDINGQAAGDMFGHWVDISLDGTILAVGAPMTGPGSSQVGYVQVYEWSDSAWQQKGSNIVGETSASRFGSHLALSNNGLIVAVGGFTVDNNRGRARVYEWDGSSWGQKGSSFTGGAGDWLGVSVTLSGDGSVFGFGANLQGAGRAEVHYWNGSDWQQRGSNIFGEANGDWSGHKVVLSHDGSILAVGAKFNDGGGTGYRTGHARVYQWNGSAWEQVGSDLDGEEPNNYFGSTLALSASGSIIAVGAYGHDGYAGRIRVFGN